MTAAAEGAPDAAGFRVGSENRKAARA